MSFRPATLDDAAFLFVLRTVAEQQPWYAASETDFHDHLYWLKHRIGNPLVRILIWEQDGKPFGVVRIDSNGDLTFDATDDDTAVTMLQAAGERYASVYGGRLKATLDKDDPRWELLALAGFTSYPARALIYKTKEAA